MLRSMMASLVGCCVGFGPIFHWLGGQYTVQDLLHRFPTEIYALNYTICKL